jgi:hypothetical protein
VALCALIVDSEARGERLAHLKCLTEGDVRAVPLDLEGFGFSQAKFEITFKLSRPSPRQQRHDTHLSLRKGLK